MDHTSELLEKLAKAVSFHYKNKCAPSVIVSWLPTQQLWHVSIAHQDKQVMYFAWNSCLNYALKRVAKDFLHSICKERDPLDDLELFLMKNDMIFIPEKEFCKGERE